MELLCGCMGVYGCVCVCVPQIVQRSHDQSAEYQTENPLPFSYVMTDWCRIECVFKTQFELKVKTTMSPGLLKLKALEFMLVCALPLW